MSQSSTFLVKIESNVDYTTDSRFLGITTLHCTKTNTKDVHVWTIGGSDIIFPPGSFVKGALYHISVKKIVFEEDCAGFVGYAQNNPYFKN